MLCFWKAEDSRMTNVTFPCVNTIQLGPSLFNSSQLQLLKLVLKRISVLNDSICILWNDAILCSSSKSYISSHFFQVERGLSPKWGDFPLKGKCWGVLHISWSFVFIWSSFYTTVKISVKISMFFTFKQHFSHGLKNIFYYFC